MPNAKHSDNVVTLMSILLVVFAIAWVAVALLPWISLRYLPSVSKETHEGLKDVLQQWGTFGDMFNCLNSLFTAAALAGVVYTTILQRQQLRLQQDEIEEARKERQTAVDHEQKTMLLDVASQLAQLAATENASNPDSHYKQWLVAYHKGDAEILKRSVYGRMVKYRTHMEMLYDELTKLT